MEPVRSESNGKPPKGVRWARWFAAGAAAGVAVVALDRVARAVLRPVPQRLERDPSELPFPYEDVWIPANGAQLRGWLLSPARVEPDAVALALVHGWTGNSGKMLVLAEPLVRAGHPALVFDVRRHGRSSDSAYVTVAHFRDDAVAAARFLAARYPERPRVIVGHSLGGAAAVLAAAQGAPVDAVVLIAAPADVIDASAEWLRARRLPGALVRLLIPFWRPRVGESLNGLAPMRKIAELTVPVLVLHGARDRRVPLWHAESLAHAAGACAVIVPEVDHHSVLRHPQTRRQILSFVRKVGRRVGRASKDSGAAPADAGVSGDRESDARARGPSMAGCAPYRRPEPARLAAWQ